jgi:hypothetical protein
VALNFERGATSKDRLKIDWTHPVAHERTGEHTSAAGALEFTEALRVIWEPGDDRPLLVLRECNLCAGSDDALLNRAASNDNVVLLTKWFRTVRLPPNVMQSNHPFHNVFARLDAKDGTPHFFLLADPTAEPVFFDGKQTQAELLKGIYSVLGQRYAKDPRKAVKNWLHLLDTFDALDARRMQLQEQLAEERATAGPDSERAKKFQAALDGVEVERHAALAREQEIRDLGLLKMSREALAAAR